MGFGRLHAGHLLPDLQLSQRGPADHVARCGLRTAEQHVVVLAELPLRGLERRAAEGPEAVVLQADGDEVVVGEPGGAEDELFAALLGGEQRVLVVGRVEDVHVVVVVHAAGHQELAGVRELEGVDAFGEPLLLLDQLLARDRVPDDQRGPGLLVSRGDGLLVRVQRHGQDVVFVPDEQPLRVGLGLVRDADCRGVVEHVSVLEVPHVVALVPGSAGSTWLCSRARARAAGRPSARCPGPEAAS